MPDPSLKQILNRLSNKLAQDKLVQNIICDLRNKLNVDRVVLYYFYCKWEGQVTFESISSQQFSILGSTGPDECFNHEYATLYEEGRISAIADINKAHIAECHRNFLSKLQIQANLVVPILTTKGLWGLLIAHHCYDTRIWSEQEIQMMQQGAKTLAANASILES